MSNGELAKKRGGPGKLSEERRDALLAELREGKTRLKDLAEKYGITPASVQYYRYREGMVQKAIDPIPRFNADQARIIEGAVAYIAYRYAAAFILSSAPRVAEGIYRDAEEQVRKAWSIDDWLQAWAFAVVRVAEKRYKEST